MKASSIDVSRTKYAFLFKGPFGFGKTLAAASFALEGPVFLSYWDKKSPIELPQYFTKARFGRKAEKILDNIEYEIYDASNPHEYLNKIIELAYGSCRYSTIINDSLTFMTSSAVNWSLNFGTADRIKKKIKDVLPDWDEYKTETSIVSQCIDLSKKLPCHVIWTAHPIATTRVNATESGTISNISKVNSLVSYGSKIASMAPGSFSEIYHFMQRSDWSDGKSTKSYLCATEAVGDEFAKSPLLGASVKELDFTNKLFYEVWKEAIEKAKVEALVSTSAEESGVEGNKIVNPFEKPITENTTAWKPNT